MDLPRNIDVLLFEGVNLMDVAGPVAAFDNAILHGHPAYHHRFVSLDGDSVTASCGLGLLADGAMGLDSNADDLMIPGGRGVDALLGDRALLGIVGGWLDGRPRGRLISVCSGSLIAAAAGALEGIPATSHWARRDQAVRDYPEVDWQLDNIYTISGSRYTSAGVSAGIDLALAIIHRDCGPMAALSAARELVVYLRRSGGQSQFSELLKGQFTVDRSLAGLLDKVTNNPDQQWTLDSMAAETAMSSRTLSRRFQDHLGLSPIQFLEKTRVHHARTLLARGLTLGRVAQMSGLGDTQRMRRSFRRHLGVSVAEYQRRFGT